MKFTVVLVVLLGLSAAKKSDDKDKREALIGFPSSNTQNVHLQPQYDQDDNSVSIGAGYSVGGGKPTYSFVAPQGQQLYQLAPQGAHGQEQRTVQLAPIMLQPEHGNLQASDLSQLMSQLSQGIASGAISLQGDPQYAAQGVGAPQYTLVDPTKYQQQYSQGQEHLVSQPPSYAHGTKGLGQYSSQGPVLFSPAAEGHQSQSASPFSAPISQGSAQGELSFPQFSGHSLAASGESPSSAHSFGGLGFGSGHGFGGSGLSLSGAGHSFGSGVQALRTPQSLGGLKAFSYAGAGHGHSRPLGDYGHTKTAFKPSAFLGASGSDTAHSAASQPSYSSSQYLSFSGRPSYTTTKGFSSGPAKYTSGYQPHKSEGFGSFSDTAASYSSSSQAASPPRTTYGVPSSGLGHMSKFYGSSKGIAPFSDNGAYRSALTQSGHSPFSGGVKYSSPVSHFTSKDSDGAYSETYNTIKYSEEMRPRV